MDIVTLALAKKSAKQYTDDAIEGLGKGIVYKGAVNYYNDLPNNASIGDCYSILYNGTSGTDPSGAEYVWGKVNNTNQWIKLGEDVDLTNYIKNTDYAGNNNNIPGIVKVFNSYGIQTDNTGALKANSFTYSQYTNLTDFAFISKATLANVLTEKIGNVETLLENLDTGNGVE